MEPIEEEDGELRSEGRRVLDHRLQQERHHRENTYQSCCGQTSDKRLLVFISTLSISLLLLTFSCFMLATHKECESQNTYVGLITLIVGVWMKSPI